MVWICVFLMHSLGHKLFYHCFNIQCISYVSRGRPSSWLLCVCFVCLFVSFWCSHRSLSVSLLSGIIAYSRFILYFPLLPWYISTFLSFLLIITISGSSQWTDLGNICMYVMAFFPVWASACPPNLRYSIIG